MIGVSVQSGATARSSSRADRDSGLRGRVLRIADSVVPRHRKRFALAMAGRGCAGFWQRHLGGALHQHAGLRVAYADGLRHEVHGAVDRGRHRGFRGRPGVVSKGGADLDRRCDRGGRARLFGRRHAHHGHDSRARRRAHVSRSNHHRCRAAGRRDPVRCGTRVDHQNRIPDAGVSPPAQLWRSASLRCISRGWRR